MTTRHLPKATRHQMANIKSSPARYVASASTSDTVDMANPGRALYVGGGGAVRIMTTGSTVATFTSVVGGTILPIETLRVYSSGTTASNILVLW